MGVSGLIQGAANEGYIVAGTTASAGLCHNDCQTVGSREQAADSDTDSAEIGDLVDLQKRIQLAGSLQNLAYLICRYGIKSASERIELNHLQFIMLADKFRCIVQPGMIYPLIHNTQGPGRLKIDGKTSQICIGA